MASKILITILFVAGIAIAAWLISPLFYDTKVNEALPSSAVPLSDSPGSSPNSATSSPSAGERTITVASGNFVGADSFHNGSGSAKLIQIDGKNYVRFAENFSVTNGPDLFVYFGKDGQYDADTNLGKLKGNIGSQNYEVPADVDPALYNEIWIWCRAFAVPFASAQLQ